MISGNLNYLPEYWRDIYGDATISWVPPVTNYLFNENVSKRGIANNEFRWEEVEINLTGVTQSGVVLDFLMPDSYLLQITPDIGWHDPLSMFGENSEIRNPHLKVLGPFSIENGSLEDEGDNSVKVTLTDEQIESAIIDDYPKYLWRAVPWAQGNPGLGGLPASFEWVSTAEQLKFTVDPVVKEKRKSAQTISGTKGTRVNITVESENSPTVFVEQTSTTWKVVFNIDRDVIKFTVVATDEGGSAITRYYVDLTYDSDRQIDGHVWNAFDSFALLASLSRLPMETNASLKERTVDAFTNRGGANYRGLVTSINRELGLKRKDSALLLSRKRNDTGQYVEQEISIDITSTRVSVYASSFTIHDEIQEIDTYYNTVTTSKRIDNILSVKTVNGQEMPASCYEVSKEIGNTLDNLIKIDCTYSGLLKVTYTYKEDIFYDQYETVGDIVNQLRLITNQFNDTILDVTLDGTLSGSEKAKYLCKSFSSVNKATPVLAIGWAPVGLFALSDEEFKWSFASNDNTFFDSEFYKFVLELKSQTNIEWGFIVCDKDYWDAVDSNQYGHDNLPTVFDVKLSKYVTAIPIADRTHQFDSYESFRMGYYYEGSLIKNNGFPQLAFRSGVGSNKDCALSVVQTTVSTAESRVNFNPVVISPAEKIVYDDTIRNHIVEF